VANPLPWFERWRIVEVYLGELRSLFLLAAIALAWFAVGARASVWLPLVLAPGLSHVASNVHMPSLLLTTFRYGTARGLSPRPSPPTPAPGWWATFVVQLWARLGTIAVFATFWIDQALMQGHAAIQALYRISLDRRNLLEWTTRSAGIRGTTRSLGGTYRQMGASCAVAVAGGAALAVIRPELLPWVAPWIGLWLAAPALAHAGVTGRA
jgi:hypothetical protein